MKSINTYLLRKAVCSAKRVVTFSQFSRNVVLTALGNNFADRVEVVSPGIDPSWLEIKRNPVPTPHLLFWGRIEEEKGLPELLIALKKVSTKIPEVRLTLVGEGKQLQKYKRVVVDQGMSHRIEFSGWLDIYFLWPRKLAYPPRNSSKRAATAKRRSAGGSFVMGHFRNAGVQP